MLLKVSHLPVLSNHTFFRYFTFTILYLAQGIPEGITYFAIPAWMAMNGKSPGEIGAFVGVLGIPWSFKFLIAPLMDRYTYLPMGRRRLWVLFGQLGLVVSFLVLGLVPDPLNNLNLLMVAGFMVSFFGAFQDVATDGMAIDIIPVQEQARANGLMWGAKIMGISGSLFLGTWLINHYGLREATIALAMLVALIMLVPILMRERPGEKILPWSLGKASAEASKLQLDSWVKIFTSLFKVFLLPSSLCMGVAFFLFNMCISLLETLLPVFTIQQMGWTNETYSNLFSTTSLVAGFLGIIAGGALADLYGKRRMMSIYLALFAGVMMAMGLLKAYWATPYFVNGFMGLYYTLYVFISIASFAIGMQLCWPRISATQFTLYMAMANVGRSVGAAMLGPLKARLPWEHIFLFIGLLAIGSLFFVIILRMKKHLVSVDELEAKHLEKEEELLKRVAA
jgi:MFS transporter, PAT family, beta-lactamase induction signal transducer AmpG